MEEVLKNLTEERQQKFSRLSAELKYLTDTQWKAIYGLCPMTQEIFNWHSVGTTKNRRGAGICCPGSFPKIPRVCTFLQRLP